MVAKQKHKAYEEHDRHKEKEKDVKFGTSVSQLTLEGKAPQNK